MSEEGVARKEGPGRRGRGDQGRGEGEWQRRGTRTEGVAWKEGPKS